MICMKKILLSSFIAVILIFSGCSFSENETTLAESAYISDATESYTEITTPNETETEDPTEPDMVVETEAETQETSSPQSKTVYATKYASVADEDGVTVIYDENNDVILREKYDSVEELLPGILIFTNNGKKNVFDTNFSDFKNGKRQVKGLIFDRMYDDIEILEGSFYVSRGSFCAEGFVVTDGERKHPSLKGNVYKDIDCSHGCFICGGMLWTYNKNLKCGLYYIDGKHCNVIFPCEADEIICASDGLTNGATYDNVEIDAERYLFVCKNQKWALYHVSDFRYDSAVQITEFIYDSITRKADGITYAMKGDVQYILDSKGSEKEVESITLQKVGELSIVMYESDPFTHGVVNKNGERVIPLKYRTVEYIDGSFFCCKDAKFEDCVVIDTNGQALTSSHLRFVFGFHAPDNKNTLLIAEYAGELTGNVFKKVLVKSDGSIIIPDLDYYSFEYAENDTYTVSLKNGETCTVNNKGEIIESD